MQLSIKYRPSRFCEVVGQSTSVRILMNSIFMDRVPKAILLSGLYGTGKTTLARLYAKALNCETFKTTSEICNTCGNCVNFQGNPFTIELDAASNNGVDDIRLLQERLKRVADIPYKVVILDECHMLSTQAQAAFLKLLEEPETDRVFILVTTNPDKLDPTVRSRCLSMPLKPLTSYEVSIGITNVLQAEGLHYDQDFVITLSQQCSGSMRDALQILDQLITNAGGETLDLGILENSLGIVTKRQYSDLSLVLSWIGNYENLATQRSMLDTVSVWDQSGVDLRQLFLEGLPRLLRDFLVYLSKANVPPLSGLDISSLSIKIGSDYINRLLQRWENLVEMMKTTRDPKFVWELYFITIL